MSRIGRLPIDIPAGVTVSVNGREVNVKGPWLCTRAVVPSMRVRGGGSIVNQSSIAAFGLGGLHHYAASKAHVLSFAEGIARELGPEGISVLAVSPGPTRTQLWPSGSRLSLAMEPDAVAEIALRSLGRRTTVVAGLSRVMRP